MADHKYAASKDEGGGCRVLKDAIRKYGWDSLTIETLVTCADDQLDEYECKFIEFYGTLVDGGWGYNLESGGSSGQVVSKATRARMRQSQLARDPRPFRRDERTKDFPKYMGIFKGYVKILGHPKCSWKSFKDPTKTLDENLADALDYYAKLESGEVVHEKKELPKGIYRVPNGYRVCVKYNKRTWNKSFSKKKYSDEERLQQAVNHLAQVRAMIESMKAADSPVADRSAVQRLDGGGGGKDEVSDDNIDSDEDESDDDSYIDKLVDRVVDKMHTALKV